MDQVRQVIGAADVLLADEDVGDGALAGELEERGLEFAAVICCAG